MSSGNDQTTGNSADGGADVDMEPSPTRSDTDRSGQTGPQTVLNENNSNISVSSQDHGLASTQTLKQTDEVPVASSYNTTEQKAESVLQDNDGGTDQGADTKDHRSPENTCLSDNQVELMDTGGDKEPFSQPSTVELPPLGQTELPTPGQLDLPPPGRTETLSSSNSSELLSKADNEPKPKSFDIAAGNVVELPPLDQACASTSGAAVAAAAAAADDTSGQSVYYIKWIMYKQNKVPIITQNENGPCPLLAIMNVLLLKGKVKLAPMIEMITSEQLMTYLGESILDSMPENLLESERANFEQNMQDAMSVMYKLQTGLDVNVRFTGVADFEYTPECIIFDLLSIPLYHGWLVDPQDPVCISAVSTCSYNQLVEKIIAQKGSDKEEVITEALVAEQFLDRTASQLTYYGLCELSTTVKEGELCVFFRNNHFSTLYRVNNELFLLVTDQGFLTESNVVWETLSNVEGDCHFVDANFRTYTKPEPTGTIATSPVAVGSEQQIDQDYQVALSLQQEGEIREEQEQAWGQYVQESSAIQMADHELARRLQEEEDRRAAAAVNASQQRAAAQQQHQGQGHPQGHPHGGQGHPPAQPHSSNSRQGRERHREDKKDKDCTIL